MPNRSDLAQLATWLAATDLTSLALDTPDGRVRLERRGASVDISKAMAPNETIAAKSPGIFLHCHPLRTAAFVQVGDDVRCDQVIGLLRVGTVLLPVRAPCAGRVEGYFAADGATVGYGAPLIALLPSETRP